MPSAKLDILEIFYITHLFQTEIVYCNEKPKKRTQIKNKNNCLPKKL